jgi:uncharacterized protein (DUF302 family)
MNTKTMDYRMSATVDLPYDRAVERTREALAAEGFGVLSEIDVKGTLQKKLDVAFRPYVILGACNPPLAHRALSSEIDIGVLLPCNVVVYAADEPGKSVVSAVNPEVSMSTVENESLRPMAAEVKARLSRVLDSLRR